MTKFLMIFSGCLLLGLQWGYGQEEGTPVTYYIIETFDGNQFSGELIYEDEEQLQLRTERMGELTFLKRDIRKIRQVTGRLLADGVFWEENPQATRYFWAPNGYGLRGGEGYYQNLWVLFNQASIGLTDNFSIGVGTVPLFLFAGTSSPVWITPKVSVPLAKDKVNIGAGVLAGTILGETDTGFGIVYGVSTFGTRDKNITFGLGYGYAAGSWANTPLINISGMLRTGKNGYLLSENYYINIEGEGLALLSLGGRRMIRKVGLDFGGFIPVAAEAGGLYVLPWLGFSVPFGNTPK